ncbi:hypothetical protein [Pedobacter xixiisoli]|uniref:Uncharacterized protein n=1 Tax=Pedobacter xixiisoli TaxID=1476464 RepID=A0A286ADJ7_9SPHI|nr:hypothetical protein [Pedobacter xixiisoli]SOD19974.1 hypothetical protein SAMN06297358_3682 [Pedobacter xixiisoli]
MSFKRILFLSSIIAVTFYACGGGSEGESNKKNSSSSTENEEGLTFRDVNGVRFYEVKRRFSNGLSFNKDGFMLQPTWILEYKAPDTMLAYSPEKKGMEAFYLQFDHGRVYNFAREFFRVKKIAKDSLILQRLQVDARVITKGEVSDVNCTYYTKDYIEKVLKTTVGELQRPTSADTAFIKNLSKRTYKHPANPDSAFAATEIVNFKPNSKNVSLKLIGYADSGAHRKSFAYMYPEYRVEINKSYKEFRYRFSVIVDVKGNLYVNRIEGVLPEDMPHRKKLIQGIADVYLKNLLHIKPGTTLGIPHSSEITISLVGNK